MVATVMMGGWGMPAPLGRQCCAPTGTYPCLGLLRRNKGRELPAVPYVSFRPSCRAL